MNGAIPVPSRQGLVENSGLTIATAKLVGRTTSGTGALEEISVGTGLSFSGGTLDTSGSGSGTVTTVGWTGGIVSVANPTTTPAFTIAGTSGGIPYFNSATTWATSGALAANAIVIGGGAGTAPATTTTGTGVLTALGINIGSAGAFVTFNGAGGTPSSLTGTNISGTAASLTAGTVTTNANLTGDVTSSGNATTLATVNANVGSFGSSTAITTFTVNAKGLITAAGTTVVIAPAGTLSGNTLASGVTASSLTSVGTLTALTIGTGGSTLLQGTSTLTCSARGSGTAAYLTVNTPGDNNITASTESIGVNFAAGTRTWATGALTTQREHVFAANTLTFNGSSTCTTAINVDIADPIAGANATITTKYALRAASLNVTGNSVLGGSLTSNSGGIITNANFTCGGTNGLIASGAASFYTSGTLGLWIMDTHNFTGAGGRLCWGTATNSSPAISRVAVNGLEIKSSAGTDTYNDASTANSGTVANRYVFGFPAPTLTSTGTSVTDTVASTVYIGGAPTASTNTTIGTAWALNVAAGNTNLGGTLTVGGGTSVKNIRHGITSAMTAGSVTVTDTGATANTRYFFTPHALGTVSVPTDVYVSSRSAGASFVLTSANVADTSVYDWIGFEP